MKHFKPYAVTIKLFIPIVAYGYLTLAVLLKLICDVDNRLINGVVAVFSCVLILICVFVLIVPKEQEDEMVQAIYSKSRKATSVFFQAALMICVVMIGLIAPTDIASAVLRNVIALYLSATLLVYSLLQLILFLVYSKRGIIAE